MKNVVLLIVFVFFGCATMAQTKEAIYTAMSNELCQEIKQKQAELLKSEELQMDLGFMMMPVILKYEAELKKVMPAFDITNQKQVELLGTEIGRKLVGCPDFLKIISAKKEEVKAAMTGDVATQTIKGTLVSVSPGEFTSINIKTNSGKTEKLWWMEYFPGEAGVANGSLLNKPVTITYTEREVYSAVLKDYVKIKVAAGLE